LEAMWADGRRVPEIVAREEGEAHVVSEAEVHGTVHLPQARGRQEGGLGTLHVHVTVGAALDDPIGHADGRRRLVVPDERRRRPPGFAQEQTDRLAANRRALEVHRRVVREPQVIDRGQAKAGTGAAGRPWARVSSSTGCRAPPTGIVVACRCASWAAASAAFGARASRRVLIPYEKKFRRLMASRSSKRNPSLKSVASQ